MPRHREPEARPFVYAWSDGRMSLPSGQSIEPGDPLPDPRPAFDVSTVVRAGWECVGRLNPDGSMTIGNKEKKNNTFQVGDQLPDGSIYVGAPNPTYGPVLILEPPKGPAREEVTWKMAQSHIGKRDGMRLPTAEECRFIYAQILPLSGPDDINRHAQLQKGPYWTSSRDPEFQSDHKMVFDFTSNGRAQRVWEFSGEARPRAYVRGVRVLNRLPDRAP